MKKILTFCATLCFLSGYGQQNLSLSEAINTALKNSYDIQLAKNNLEISQVNNNIGVAGGLPSVNGVANDNEQLTTINQKFPDASRDTKRNNVASNNLQVGVTGSILLFNGNRVLATKTRLAELEKQNKDVLNQQIQNTLAAVMTKYYDIVRQQSYTRTINQSIEVSQKRLDILKVRKTLGLSNDADIFQAQLDLNSLLQARQTQDLVIEQAKTDLLNLIFVKPDTQITISDTILIDRSLKLDSIQIYLKNNPQLIAANRQININEQVEKEIAAQRYPTIRATTGFNLTSTSSGAGFILLNQSYGPFVGLNMSIPIYNGSINKRQQKVASINTKNAALQRDNLVLDNETSAIRTFQAYTNTLNQINTGLQNYNLSTQLLDLVLQRFQLGQATIIDVKQAQQSFESEGYRLVNLSYAAKVSEIELKRLASQLAL